MTFERFVAIDWTGARGVRHPAIQMAYADADGPPIIVTPERPWSRVEVADWIAGVARRGERWLIGIDCSFGLPFADRGGFFPGEADSPAHARSLWAEVERHAAADLDLGGHGYIAHRRAHFWTGVADGPRAPFARLRVAEHDYARRRLGQPASPFVLVGASQVGKATLSGMRLLHRLAGAVPVWPFDPLPATGPLLVEIYCQAFAQMAGTRGKLRDRAALDTALAALGSPPARVPARFPDHVGDALISAAGLRAVAADAAWWHPAALTPEIAATEGWTFGIA